jgi:hypothetical protein
VTAERIRAAKPLIGCAAGPVKHPKFLFYESREPARKSSLFSLAN